MRWVSAPPVGFTSTVIALVGYLLLASREELAFRGYPLRRLHRLFQLWVAQVSIALLFAVEHKLGGSPWIEALLGAGVGSLLFGMAAIATRGLAVPIGLHAAWNFGQWTLGIKGTPGFWKSIVETPDHESARLSGLIIYVAVIGSATTVLWLHHQRQVGPRTRVG